MQTGQSETGPVIRSTRSRLGEAIVNEAALSSLKLTRMNARYMNGVASRSLHKQDSFAYKVVNSMAFAAFTYIIIVVSVVFVGISLDLDPDLVGPGGVTPRDPELDVILDVFRNVLCGLFTAEFLLRLFSYRRPVDYFRDPQKRTVNIIDLIVLVLFIVDVWILEFTEQDETLAIRLLRLSLLLRLIHVLRHFPDFRILVRAVVGSARSIFISLLPLLAVIYTFGVAMTEWCRSPTTSYLVDFGDYFGTVPRSMLTMWQIAMADGVFDLIRDVTAEAPLWGCLLIAFMFLGNFMILNVLVGVIREVVFTTTRSFKLEFVQSIVETLYDDLSRNGHISLAELVKHGAGQLKRFGLDPALIPTIYAHMDVNDTGEIPREVFIVFFLRILRSPESQDLLIALKTAMAIRAIARSKKLAFARSLAEDVKSFHSVPIN